MIKVKNLNKSFNRQQVLKNINLEIQEAEILVVMGESGSGKTVFLQHLDGLIKPDNGSIEINGRNIVPLPENELLKIRKGIGYLFQEGALFDFMTVLENLSFPLEEHANLSHIEIKDKVNQVLKEVGLEGAEGKYPSQLSGGMKKRAALARAVILGSKILFCDEPTSGLDPQRSRDISDLIHNISRKFGSTTVVTSHDVINSFRIADRLALIRDGEIVAVGTRKDLEDSQNPLVKKFLLKA